MSARRDITIIKGDSYTHTLTFETDQSEYTYTATLSSETATTSFVVTTVSTTETTLFLAAATTDAFDVTAVYKWRVIRTDGTNVTTILHGRANVVDV